MEVNFSRVSVKILRRTFQVSNVVVRIIISCMYTPLVYGTFLGVILLIENKRTLPMNDTIYRL